MKAVVDKRYGTPDVLRLADVPTPKPRDTEVLVRVRAVSLNASDWELLRGKPLYRRAAPGGSHRVAGHPREGTRPPRTVRVGQRWWRRLGHVRHQVAGAGYEPGGMQVRFLSGVRSRVVAQLSQHASSGPNQGYPSVDDALRLPQ